MFTIISFKTQAGDLFAAWIAVMQITHATEETFTVFTGTVTEPKKTSRCVRLHFTGGDVLDIPDWALSDWGEFVQRLITKMNLTQGIR